MITKLTFKDGTEVIHEDTYPIINGIDDWLDVHSSVDGTKLASYELNELEDLFFSNRKN